MHWFIDILNHTDYYKNRVYLKIAPANSWSRIFLLTNGGKVWYILTIRGRKILTVPTSDGENNILSRIGGMSEELYVSRVAPQASPRGKPSGLPLGQHSGHTNPVTISCKGIFWIRVIIILRIYFYLIMRTKCHYISFKIFSNVIQFIVRKMHKQWLKRCHLVSVL